MNLRAVVERLLPERVTDSPEHERVEAVLREAALVQAQARQWAVEVQFYQHGRGGGAR